MEKEFDRIMIAVTQFSEYIENAKITYLLSDNQPILWSLTHAADYTKFSRQLLKLLN